MVKAAASTAASKVSPLAYTWARVQAPSSSATSLL